MSAEKLGEKASKGVWGTRLALGYRNVRRSGKRIRAEYDGNCTNKMESLGKIKDEENTVPWRIHRIAVV